MSKANAVEAKVEAPVVETVETPAINLPSEPFAWLKAGLFLEPNVLDCPTFTGLVIDKRGQKLAWSSTPAWSWYSLTERPEVTLPAGLSKVKRLDALRKDAMAEEKEEARYLHFAKRTLADLNKLCVNPLINVYTEALEVAKADLVAVQVLLQEALGNVAFLQSELAKLTGSKTPKGNTTIARTTSNRNRDNADRFGLVGNESSFMEAIAIGPCTMSEALDRCGQRHPQYRLVDRMVAAGHLRKDGKILSLA